MATTQRINELIHAYAEGPRLLESTVAEISEDERRFKPGPEHWSIHENVVHVADCDLVFAERIRRVLAEPGAPLIAIDENQWARVLDYPAQSFEGSLALLRALRTTTADMLRQAPVEAWAQTGMHSEKGPQTLEWIVGYAADHVHYHLRTIAKRRRQYAEVREVRTAR
ncbi:MAG: DinB family protein [bacterium]